MDARKFVGSLLVVTCFTVLLSNCGDSDNPVPVQTRSEAGFSEIEPISFSFQQEGLRTLNYTSSRARLFYSFQPAESDARNKPLFVLLNGGPGCATTTNFFSMNTATYTLDKERTGGEPCKKNPYSWTQLGNLLYIDAPNTDFPTMSLRTLQSC